MSKYKIRVSELNPWWFRLIILIIIGLPPLTGWPVYNLGQYNYPIYEIASLMSYCVFIWLIIWMNLDETKFLNYLSGAFILALTTSLSGSALRKLLPFLGSGLSPEEIDIKMIKLFITILSVVPYGLFFVNSFSVSGLLQSFSKKRGKFKQIGPHIALTLRIFQHVGEVFTNLLTVWKEENPEKIIPRFRKDLSNSIVGKSKMIKWFYNSLVIWGFACLIYTFEAIPIFVDEIKNIESTKA